MCTQLESRTFSSNLAYRTTARPQLDFLLQEGVLLVAKHDKVAMGIYIICNTM